MLTLLMEKRRPRPPPPSATSALSLQRSWCVELFRVSKVKSSTQHFNRNNVPPQHNSTCRCCCWVRWVLLSLSLPYLWSESAPEYVSRASCVVLCCVALRCASLVVAPLTPPPAPISPRRDRSARPIWSHWWSELFLRRGKCLREARAGERAKEVGEAPSIL